MMKQTNFSEDLKKSGLKNTKRRAAVLAILEQSAQPIGAQQIFFELKERNIQANLSTVYRILESLCDRQLATRLNIVGASGALFEFNRRLHRHYLVCLKCKKILSIDYCPLESYEKFLTDKTNYSITGHRLDIYGYCPDCREG